MKPKPLSTRTAGTGSPTDTDPFPPVFIEALAYHESGHAVMAVLLDVPMHRIVIGPACDDPGFNGKVELDPTAGGGKVPVYKVGLFQAASEPAEKLAPSHGQFATMHKTHRHLKPFSRGVRNDLARGFNAAAVTYQILGLAESTARKRFKREYRDLACLLFEVKVNRAAVHRLAGVLMTRHCLAGEEARATILNGGPLSDEGLLARWSFPSMTPNSEGLPVLGFTGTTVRHAPLAPKPPSGGPPVPEAAR